MILLRDDFRFSQVISPRVAVLASTATLGLINKANTEIILCNDIFIN